MRTIALILLLALPACARYVGNGDVVTEVRDVAAFDGVANQSFLDVEVVVDADGSALVEVTCDSNLQTYIDTDVDGGTLEIGVDSGVTIDPTERCVVDVVVDTLLSLDNSGSGDLFASGDVDELSSTDNNGSGSLDVRDVEVGTLDMESSGSGKTTAEGQCDRVEVDSHGSGDVDARDLIAEHADVTNSGSGDVEVTATDSCDVEVNGSGDVHVYGDPENVNQQTNGSGDVIIH